MRAKPRARGGVQEPRAGAAEERGSETKLLPFVGGMRDGTNVGAAAIPSRGDGESAFGAETAPAAGIRAGILPFIAGISVWCLYV